MLLLILLPGACIAHPGAAPLVVFPEGTTSNGHFLTHFHTGAFRSGEPVQPLIIKYDGENFYPSFDSIPHVYFMFRLMTQLYLPVTLTFLPVYYPSDEEKRNPALYAHNVRQLMAREGKFKLSDATLSDKLRLHDLIRKGVYKWDELSEQV